MVTQHYSYAGQPGHSFCCYQLDLISFLPPNLQGRLVDRHQTLHIWCFRCNFSSTLWLDREYLQKATKYHLTENDVANCDHSQTCILNLVNFGLQIVKNSLDSPNGQPSHWALLCIAVGHELVALTKLGRPRYAAFLSAATLFNLKRVSYQVGPDVVLFSLANFKMSLQSSSIK